MEIFLLLLLGITLVSSGVWWKHEQPIRKYLKKVTTVPKRQIHEILPEILEWKVGDVIEIDEISSFAYSYKAVTDDNKIVLLKSLSPPYDTSEKILEEFDLRETPDGVPVLIRDTGLNIRQFRNQAATQRRLTNAIENSQYNKFLQDYSELLSLQMQSEKTLITSGIKTA
jgi:hypothetical protein